MLFTINYFRSISFFCQNAHHDWLRKEYISNWFLVNYATVADLNVEDILQYIESVAKQSTLLPTQGCHHL